MRGRRETLRRRTAVTRNERLFEQVSRALDRNADAFDRQAAIMGRHSDAVRDAMAALREHEVKAERDITAVIGALIDLANEIRR